jgi:hypothetical protein
LKLFDWFLAEQQVAAEIDNLRRYDNDQHKE